MIINYDKYSLTINNQRILIKSAAIHYFRMPGQNMWRDRLSKLKACGYNTVDIYFCWGYHSDKPGVYDFTGIKDIRVLLDMSVEMGFYVIARPGPYINAEVSLGGMPLWLLEVPGVHLRNRISTDFAWSEPFMKYVKEWYSRIIPIINEYHNIIAFQIENEYFSNEAEPDYIQALYHLARQMGIKTPIFHNDVLNAGLYSDIVDIYAFDTYPTVNVQYDWREFPDCFGVLDNAENNLGECSKNGPLFIAELQAGWYDKWNGIGYENIRKKFSVEHINIATKTALSQGVTLFNHYMGCGGTSWGNLACSETYTSYDFASPVSEEGIPGENYYKAKEINYFTNAFNLACTDLSEEGCEITGCEIDYIYSRTRNDNINKCKWLFIRNLNPQTKKLKIFDKFNLSLPAWDMKILPLDLSLKACKIEFSGMSIFAKVNHEELETLYIILEKDNHIIFSDFESVENIYFIMPKEGKIVIDSNNLKDMDFCVFKKVDKSTKIIFITLKTADLTWISGNRVIMGADFITDNFQKAAVLSEREIKILKPSENLYLIKAEAPPEVILPDISELKILKCSPEIDPGFDYSGWNYVDNNKFDCISNGIFDDYIWYKGIFKGHIDQIQISALHCFSVYLNNHQIFYHDSLHYEAGTEIVERINFGVDKHFLKDLNEITILVQNLGFDRGFSNELTSPRGMLGFKTFPEKQIEWQIKGGLIPNNEEWHFASISALENASDNSFLLFIHTNFKLEKNSDIFNPFVVDTSEFPIEKADIYLNANLIGRRWKNKSPQTSFYLPEDFLEAKNTLTLIAWDISPSQNNLRGYENNNKYVKIKIRGVKNYRLIQI